MVDQFDLAQELDAQFRDQALALHRRAARTGTRASRENCIDCGEEIPLARRIAAPGCQRCIACATVEEKARSRV